MSHTLSLQELQKKELEILKIFHAFCDKHQLRYYLYYGTLLGAVRHNGFIPWDDDVDVIMPRNDYKKFIELFPKYNQIPYIKMASLTNTPEFYLPLIKLYDSRTPLTESVLKHPLSLGPWIDIFPLDNMSDEYSKAKHLFQRVSFWRRLRSWKLFIPSGMWIKRKVKVLLQYVLFFVPTPFILHKIDKLSQIYNAQEFTKYIGIVSHGAYGLQGIMDKKLYENRILHPFEDTAFYIPEGFDSVLTHLYGDYMTPINNQNARHFDDTQIG